MQQKRFLLLKILLFDCIQLYFIEKNI